MEGTGHQFKNGKDIRDIRGVKTSILFKLLLVVQFVVFTLIIWVPLNPEVTAYYNELAFLLIYLVLIVFIAYSVIMFYLLSKVNKLKSVAKENPLNVVEGLKEKLNLSDVDSATRLIKDWYNMGIVKLYFD